MPASWRSWISLGLALLLSACALQGPAPEIEDAASAADRATPATPAGEVPDAADELRRSFDHALALMQDGQWAEAEAALRPLTRNAPEHLGPWINLGITLARQGRDEQALAVLGEALKRDPDQALARHETAILLRRAGRFAESREAYEAALRVQPEMALAHRNLGLLCDLYLHDLECALRHYRRYQALDGGNDPEVELWILDLQRRIDGN